MRPNIRLTDKHEIDYTLMMEALCEQADQDYRRETYALIGTLLLLSAFASLLAFWPELTWWW